MKTLLSTLLTSIFCCSQIGAQTYIDPSDALAVWDFDNNAVVTQSSDLLQGTPMVFQGTTSYTNDAGGRSGQAGDRAMNFGTTAGNHAIVNNSAFMSMLNSRNTNDQLTVVFWQKWNANVASSSSVWFYSASALGNRGFQAHVPWTDNTIYYDHSGCCTAGAQRLNASMTSFNPSFSWQTWHHVALVKNGGIKQIWINGVLFASQSTGAAALLNDWTHLIVGQQSGSANNTVRGMIDDFALFGTALNSTQIAALAAGTEPMSLIVPAADRPPVISSISPANHTPNVNTNSAISCVVTTDPANTISPANITLLINGVNQTHLASIGGAAHARTISYNQPLAANQYYSITVTASDQNARSTSASWSFDTIDASLYPNYPNFNLTKISAVPAQSTTDGANNASMAIDNNTATFSQTADAPGSYWEMEWPRSIKVSRILITAPSGSENAGVLDNCRVRVFDVKGQLMHQSTITRVAPSATWAILLPGIMDARSVRIDLPSGQTNGQGSNRIAVAELRMMGDASPEFGAIDLINVGSFLQSSTNATNVATNAADGNPATICETTNTGDSYWQVTLDRSRSLHRVEITNAAGSPARLAGLTLRALDANGITLATATLTNPGASATWAYDFPANMPPAKVLRIGLENNATNGNGDRVVSFADLALFSGINYARHANAYMHRLNDSLPAAALANDGNVATHTETTTQTTDGWWECDLGETRSLYAVRCIPFDATTNQQRLSHATVRLYDENHDSVYSQHLSGTDPVFQIALPGPVNARYVRVGFENKERSSPDGSVEWYLRLREVQAFGRPVNESGLLSFSASSHAITGGQSVQLQWNEEDLSELALYPNLGSAGPLMDPNGTGMLSVTPSISTEYFLVAKNYNTPVVQPLTVVVDGALLPIRISEFCASNRFSLTDGFGDEPDWIELRNPNRIAIDISGYGLSDNAGLPMKWTFPAGTSIPPNRTLLVMASNRNSGADAKGFLHTNFSLNAAGESVVLTTAGGVTADAILNYPGMREDLTYGRTLDGAIAFLDPTPGEVNLAESYQTWLNPPDFSHVRGFHDQAFALVLSHANPAGDIYYSLNGSDPNLLYTGPITISSTTPVRATVRLAGAFSPATVTHTYVFRNSVMSSPLMSTTYTQDAQWSTRLYNSLTKIPTICVNVPVVPDDYQEREASIEVIMPDGSTAKQINAGLARTGGSWTNFAKKSYRVSFRESYGAKNLDFPLFRGFDNGIPATEKVDTLELNAGNHDMSQRGFYMASRFVEDATLEMGTLNSHGRFVHVYLNGQYWGQYNARERMEDSFLAAYLGGKNSDYVNVKGNDNSGDNFIIGTPEPPNRASWETARANASNYDIVKNHVDLQSLIDFMLLWNYGNCESEFRCSGPVNVPGSGFKFWMADSDGFLRTSALTLDRTANTGPGGFFGALNTGAHPDFKMLLADRIYKHFFNGGALTPEKNLARLNRRMLEVQDSLIAECARWNYRTPANWESSAETIRTGLFPSRTSNLFAMLKTRGYYPAIDPPVLSQHGGSIATGGIVSLQAGTGTIYYTNDGSDPRLPGGAVSPKALIATVSTTERIAFASPWKYFTTATLPAANWFSPAYNDNSWSTGNAPLGYGGSTTTTLSTAIRTAYFRKVINIPSLVGITGINLGLKRDDGAVIYINGTEVARHNMPAGTVTYSTLASTTVAGNDKLISHAISVPATGLVAGNNVIAVEVHQSSTSSSDLFFDLSLSTSNSPLITINQNTNIKTRLLEGTTWSALADTDFRVTHSLENSGTYLFTQWDAASPANSTPVAMRLMQTDLVDPPLSAAMNDQWKLPFNRTSRSRINGLGNDGIGFINTDSTQTEFGSGYVGAAILSLDTSNKQNIQVLWRGGTVAANTRDYGIRLQYRVGSTESFADLLDSNGQPVEYLKNISGHSALIGPVTLPAVTENQPLVELRWKYYYRSGSTGARPQLRIDDIQVSAGPVTASALHVMSAPPMAQVGATMLPITVEARASNGSIATAFNGSVTLSSAGTLSGTRTVNAVNGVAVFSGISFLSQGVFTLQASASSLPSATAVVATRVVGLTETVMPLFIQGMQPENNRRVPFSCLLRLENLRSNSTYRYAPQFIDGEDGATDEGSGNMILVGNQFVRCTESPRFFDTDVGIRHGQFVSAPDGSYTGWFMIEPTNHVRFTPGNRGWIRLHLNDGEGGESTALSLTSSAEISVMEFGSAAQQGSALYGNTPIPEKDFLLLRANANGSGRPVAVAVVENSGAATDTSYAPFYLTHVAGQTGKWGAMIPNNLVGGIRHIEHRSAATGVVIGAVVHEQGLPLTAMMSSGDTGMGVHVPLTNANSFTVWRSARFALSDFSSATIGSPVADPDTDGRNNLLEYALGTDPWLPNTGDLPDLKMNASNATATFQYRRRIGAHGLNYVVEYSDRPDAWQDAASLWLGGEQVVPHADGITETVTLTMPVTAGKRFLRLRVTDPQP